MLAPLQESVVLVCVFIYIYKYIYIYKLDLKAGVAEGGKGLSRGRSSSVGAGREGRNILIEKKSWVEGADLVKGG